jgi:hypothetical protein
MLPLFGGRYYMCMYHFQRILNESVRTIFEGRIGDVANPLVLPHYRCGDH